MHMDTWIASVNWNLKDFKKRIAWNGAVYTKNNPRKNPKQFKLLDEQFKARHGETARVDISDLKTTWMIRS